MFEAKQLWKVTVGGQHGVVGKKAKSSSLLIWILTSRIGWDLQIRGPPFPGSDLVNPEQGLGQRLVIGFNGPSFTLPHR